MLEFFSKLFRSGDFVPRWQCGDWSAGLMWTHIVADGLIWLCYMAIPITLIYFIWRRGGDTPFPRLFAMFGLFIVSCGFTHFIDAFAFVSPLYRLSAVVKVITALSSLATVAALIQVAPAALTLPGLKALNDRLTREIREKEEAERQVRALNRELNHRVQELQTVLDVIPVAVAVTSDPHGDRIRMNAYGNQLLRVAPETNASASGTDAAALTFRVCKDGRELAASELPMQYACSHGQAVRDVELDLVFSDGQTRHLLEFAVPLFDESRSVRGCVGVFVDLTDRRREEAQARALELRILEHQKLESLGLMAGGVAHDFNNLLMGVMGNANLARREIAPDSAAQPMLDRVERSARRAADLTRQMLAFSGKGRFLVTPIDLNRLIEEMTQLLEASISKKAKVQFEFAANLPVIDADAGQITQIVMNLITNASEALEDESGTILIRTSAVRPAAAEIAQGRVPLAEFVDGPYVQFEVTDTGCGMTADTIERLFEPFFTTKFTGRGLGLAAVIGVVRGHKGTIFVESKPGIGTTFRVLLPASWAGVRDSDPAPAPRLTSGEPVHAVVLVVDDCDLVRPVASRMLRLAGHEVLMAADGEEALRVFFDNAERIDLVLLDMTMPGLSGREVLTRIRQRKPRLPVILSSGYNQQEAIREHIADRSTGFIQKPYTVEQLHDKVAQALTRSSTSSVTQA